ncbi:MULTISPECIES: tRNA (guanosine(37)-N1)-methyltransferase TrmD [Anaerococcus]|uniref:tRNA (guanine-N(1)-)-methyltransferase n=1 Tax=Anaerococcus nagyae TaxID=1755241 RepID=A0A3E2TJE4_9FIRM|nr:MULTISPECIES: tRNA (guanosine(37)-N1)-methyltransferase TrmD [Anaerococcus]MBP2069490.1 tRNA (guanine37-N1)-methyltransferase [Anaerococcus nagyae]MDU1829433.1 tRNA (guanosine(37)-N1)-methyltransferase TrmD [Anaerococcus sp.]MDU1864199.1 tRNA (guanosine(37)-N1)-methyltransferase TrmD [Anaerococcus sp.]MDU2354055.1 tRNA (guanosine(37)-N1)-methyltransferase TrmD [Anaerococcus sp.]MDU2565342.1 tRNA (guanosine(37)-N1)-methyltransferase TrmD [Anaerococcus sp.]
MNKITILTLFPESFEFLKTYGVIGKAISKGLLELEFVNIRDFSNDKHNHVDDTVYGGAAGMLMKPKPLYDALMSVKKTNSKVAYMSATGRVLDQKLAINLADIEHLILICGHYEGIDARIINHYVDYEISIGDYVLTGGEIPAMVLIDSMSRFIDGVVGKEESLKTDSHYNTLLQQDEYTKPRNFNGYFVPHELVSGDHKKIAAWNKKSAIEKTKKVRPDLYEKFLREENENGLN